MTLQKTISVKLLPHQRALIDSTAKECLLSGSWGSAKSYALCWAVLREATIPNAQILLCRKTYTSLKRSTLQTFLQIAPQNSYIYNKVEQTLKLNGSNSTIYLMGLDDINKVRSMNLSMIAVDECSELVEEEWLELLGRLRSEYGSRRIIGATNPASPSHFLYKRFFIDEGDRQVIKSLTSDNPYLPKDYLESLKSLPKQLYDRYVLGEWLALDKVIYSQFDRKYVRKRKVGEFKDFVIGLDFGFTNPIGLTFWGIDGDKNLHLLDEVKESGLLISKIADLCAKYEKFQPTIVVDPSAPALIAELNSRGLNAIKADNDVESGISKLQDYLGKGKITVEPKCNEWIKEVENYIRDDKGKPTKIEDHLCDSSRYVISYVVGESLGYIKPTFLDDSEEDEEEIDMWSTD